MLEPFFVKTFVKNEKILKKVDPMQVAGLSTVKNYTKIILIDDTAYMVRMSLANALKKFPPDMFVKIDRAIVVSKYAIDYITRDHLIICGNTELTIARKYYRYVAAGLNIIE
jgi:DNA-binding LytR/AlgR family response regulator